MKALVQYAPGEIRLEEIAIPRPGPGEVLVKVLAAGVCGTDPHRKMRKHPAIPGHEFAGKVVEVGANVTKVNTGTLVVVAPLVPCFECFYCTRGNYVHCANYTYLGSSRDGGFAEYSLAPAANLLPVPLGMDYEVASLTEPATVALHACRRGGISAGDVVLVLGAGAIGLFATWWARIMGCKMVIVVDIFDEKLQIAKRLGADILVNVAGGDVVELVRRNLSGEKVDVVIEAAGSPITQKASIELIRNLGVIVLLGTSHSDLSITPELYEKILRKEIDIRSSWGPYSNPFPGEDWETAMHFLCRDRDLVRYVVSHRLPLENGPEVYHALRKRTIPASKVLFVPAEECG